MSKLVSDEFTLRAVSEIAFAGAAIKGCLQTRSGFLDSVKVQIGSDSDWHPVEHLRDREKIAARAEELRNADVPALRLIA